MKLVHVLPSKRRAPAGTVTWLATGQATGIPFRDVRVLCTFLDSLMYTTCSTHVILLALITVTILVEEYTL